MRIVIQRVTKAKVTINNKVNGEITNGLLLLTGFTEGDDLKIIDKMVDKVINLRIFDDKDGNMNLSLIDTSGSILSISQFTLYADSKKGRRPSFIEAMNKEEATILYDMFNTKLRTQNITVEEGIFGADMDVEFINNGPVTIILDSKEV